MGEECVHVLYVDDWGGWGRGGGGRDAYASLFM